jgi:hypothetical protein
VRDADLRRLPTRIARTTFLEAKVLFTRTDVKDTTDAFKEAVNLRREVRHAIPTEERDLLEENFDDLAAFLVTMKFLGLAWIHEPIFWKMYSTVLFPLHEFHIVSSDNHTIFM